MDWESRTDAVVERGGKMEATNADYSTYFASHPNPRIRSARLLKDYLSAPHPHPRPFRNSL